MTDTYTTKVKVPVGFQPSSSERGWFINPMGRDNSFSPYVALGAIGPALLLFILVSELNFLFCVAGSGMTNKADK